MVEYLVESFVRGVPREACQVRPTPRIGPTQDLPPPRPAAAACAVWQACGKRLFPADPEAAAALLRTADEAKRATRIYCGHWFHYACLARFITEPPFGKPCPVRVCARSPPRIALTPSPLCGRGLPQTCGKTVQHPDWPSDVKKLEKRWAHTQAKKREVDEVGFPAPGPLHRDAFPTH